MFALKSRHHPISAHNVSGFTHKQHCPAHHEHTSPYFCTECICLHTHTPLPSSPQLGARPDKGLCSRHFMLLKPGLRYTNPVHFVFKEQLQAGFLKLRSDTGLSAARYGPFLQPSRKQRTFHSVPSEAHSSDVLSRHRVRLTLHYRASY